MATELFSFIYVVCMLIYVFCDLFIRVLYIFLDIILQDSLIAVQSFTNNTVNKYLRRLKYSNS